MQGKDRSREARCRWRMKVTKGLEEFEAASPAEREAAEWLLRLQGEAITDAEVAEWLTWCSVPEHLQAFDETQRLYDQLRNVSPEVREKFLSLDTSANASAETLPTPKRLRVLHRSGLGLLAAAASAAILVFAWSLWGRTHPVAPETRDYRAPRGSPVAVVLADRSRVTLSSGTDVFTQFTDRRRDTELRSGEAYFEIEHDSGRPFTVRVESVLVTAIGTRFDVRKTADRTVIVVTEGAIEVATVGDGRMPGQGTDLMTMMPVRVTAGQQAVKSSTKRGVEVSDVDSRIATAWLQGKLAYILEPLGSVVDDVDRYATRRIEIVDPAIRNFVFTGTVFTEHVDDWALTLDKAFPLQSVVMPDGTIQLRLRSK